MVHSLDVLKILLSSDLGNEILHLPVCYDATPKSQPRLELLYSECSPVSFLLSTKMDELKDDIIVYLDLLLSHGNCHNLQKSFILVLFLQIMLLATGVLMHYLHSPFTKRKRSHSIWSHATNDKSVTEINNCQGHDIALFLPSSYGCDWSISQPKYYINHPLPNNPHFSPEDGGTMFCQNATMHNNPEECHLYLHCCQNLILQITYSLKSIFCCIIFVSFGTSLFCRFPSKCYKKTVPATISCCYVGALT